MNRGGVKGRWGNGRRGESTRMGWDGLGVYPYPDTMYEYDEWGFFGDLPTLLTYSNTSPGFCYLPTSGGRCYSRLRGFLVIRDWVRWSKVDTGLLAWLFLSPFRFQLCGIRNGVGVMEVEGG